tara:strand:+ start:125 stop:1000 length:876 start_codon:yes stop_codon:yes gene_type:complete
MKVSIIIRTRNEIGFINNCLEKIFSQVVDFKYEVILIDTESNDGTLDVAKDYGLKVISIKQEDFSFPLSLNIGLPSAQGDFIVYISGHSYPENKYWLSNLISPFEDDSIIAVGGPIVMNPIYKDNPFLTFYDLNTNKTSSYYSTDNQFLSNTNTAYRKAILSVNLFDEKITDTEEKYWANTMLIKYPDSKIYYSGGAIVCHSHPTNAIDIWNLNYSSGKWYASTYFLSNKEIKLFDIIKKTIKNIYSNYLHYFKTNNTYKTKWIFLLPTYHIIKQISFYIGTRFEIRNDIN